MRLAIVVCTGRDDAERLAFEDRERLTAKVEDDVADVVVGVVGETEVAGDLGRGGFGGCVEVDRGFRGGCGGLGFTARAGMRLCQKGGDRVIERFEPAFSLRHFGEVLLLWQFLPRVLFFEGVGRRHDTPFIDRACRTDRDALHAEITDFRIDDDVVVVVFDRVDRAGILAGVAANTDLWVDQMLF